MSHSPGTHSPNIPYDPLPLSQDERSTVYLDPPSTPLTSGFDTPPVELTSFMSGTATPRFLPAAQHFEDGSEYRDSLLSQNTFQTPPSAVGSSVYALRPDSAAVESTGYRDDPGLDTIDPSDSPRYLEEKRSAYSSPGKKSKRTIIIFGSIAAAVIVIVAVVVPVYFTVIKPKTNNNNVKTNPPNPTSTGTGTGDPTAAVITGGNGSTITTENGTTFTYINPFGGTWYWDPSDPFNNNAQPNSWTPPLNQTFQFGIDKIFGFVIFDSFIFII